MARSVFYYHLKRLKAKDKYASEKEMIKSIFHDHKGRYGYRRVTAEMRNNDVVLNHKTVQRLMVQMGLKSQIRKDSSTAKCATVHIKEKSDALLQTSSTETLPHQLQIANGLLMLHK